MSMLLIWFTSFKVVLPFDRADEDYRPVSLPLMLFLPPFKNDDYGFNWFACLVRALLDFNFGSYCGLSLYRCSKSSEERITAI